MFLPRMLSYPDIMREFKLERGLKLPAKGKQLKKVPKVCGYTKDQIAVMETEQVKAVFIQAFAKYRTLGVTAKRMGLLRSTVETWVVEDPAFRESLVDSHEAMIDQLEAAAIRRALSDSDDLLKFMLRANRRAKYSDNIPAKALDGEAGSAGPAQEFIIAGQVVTF